jgi:hypothetical protein
MKKIGIILLAVVMSLAIANTSEAHDGPVRKVTKATACAMQRATCNTQRAVKRVAVNTRCTMQRAVCNTRCAVKRATVNTRCAMQRAACNTKRAVTAPARFLKNHQPVRRTFQRSCGC